MVRYLPIVLILFVVLFVAPAFGAAPNPLATGVASHAFDHLGDIGDQSTAASAAGCNILYTTALGSLGYQGLPRHDELEKARDAASRYIADAKAGKNIRLVIGYVCATSIVKLATFDQNWPDDFRADFTSSPASWLQRSADGKPLKSWYGGDYAPACMNNPDWRDYEEHIIYIQLKVGCDGIFFDNPTVHPDGCYCPWCMRKFAAFLTAEGDQVASRLSLKDLRSRAGGLEGGPSADFLRFRATIAADFLADMRKRARRLYPDALITANNSLNSPEAFYSQTRTYGYSIFDMTRDGGEDFAVIEDMATQPRILADGKTTVEYGPVYDLLHGITHNKPIVACVLAEADYHTPPNLMRLAMAEAAAHDASYMSWPTWPTEQRQRMSAAVREENDFLQKHADLFQDSSPLTDVALMILKRGYANSSDFPLLKIARELASHNIPFRAITEESLPDLLPAAVTKSPPPRVLIGDDARIFTEAETNALVKYRSNGGTLLFADHPDLLVQVRKAVPAAPIELLAGPPTVRAVVRRQEQRTIVHLYNLNIQRLSSFEDKVTAASDVRLRIRCPAKPPTRISALTADADGTRGSIPFTLEEKDGVAFVELTVPRLVISTMLVIQ